MVRYLKGTTNTFSGGVIEGYVDPGFIGDLDTKEKVIDWFCFYCLGPSN